MTLTKEQRAAISRANGAKSRGPKTVEGKAISSRNAMRHGLTARKIIISAMESESEYSRFQAMLKQQLAPQDALQAVWVDKVITGLWRARRAGLEEALIVDEENSCSFGGRSSSYIIKNEKRREAILRYEEAINKQVLIAMRELEKLQAASSSFEPIDITPSVSVRINDFEPEG